MTDCGARCVMPIGARYLTGFGNQAPGSLLNRVGRQQLPNSADAVGTGPPGSVPPGGPTFLETTPGSRQSVDRHRECAWHLTRQLSVIEVAAITVIIVSAAMARALY